MDAQAGRDAGRERWQRRFDQAAKRDADFSTLSGLEVDPVYGPPDGAVVPDFDRIGWPGEFPFTRGIHATGYRGKPWTIRQFSGFGNARQTNERYKMLLAAGGAGLSAVIGLIIGTTSLAALGPAVTVLALIVVAFELVLNRLAPIRPH